MLYFKGADVHVAASKAFPTWLRTNLHDFPLHFNTVHTNVYAEWFLKMCLPSVIPGRKDVFHSYTSDLFLFICFFFY